MIYNLRDLGGIKNKEGKTIAKGYFYRSAGLLTIDDEDKKFLKDELKLSRIIDLRTAREYAVHPDEEVEGIAYNHFPLAKATGVGLSDTSGSGSLYDRLRACSSDEERIALMPRMDLLYRQMLTTSFSRTNFRALIRDMVSYKYGPTLFHCAQGKDRTGMVAAAIYIILGVDRENIIKEYLISRDNSRREMEGLYKKTLAAGFDDKVAREIARLGTVEEKDILAFFDEIDKQFGGDEGFINEYLSVNEDDLAEFRGRMLE